MSADSDRDDIGHLAAETEIRELKQRLAVREQALSELNRRVVQLERGGSGVADISLLIVRNRELEARVQELEPKAIELEAELDRVYATKLFRWTRPARAAYEILRKTGIGETGTE